MIESGRLEILVPAKQICDRYRRYLGAGVTRELYRIDLPALQVKPSRPEDFETLRFILPGRFADYRKGQLSVLYAFAAFYHRDFRRDPTAYRDFTLSFVGLEDDFMSRQLERHANILGDRLICHPRVEPEIERSRSSAPRTSRSVTRCAESFGLFVIEGMHRRPPRAAQRLFRPGRTARARPQRLPPRERRLLAGRGDDRAAPQPPQDDQRATGGDVGAIVRDRGAIPGPRLRWGRPLDRVGLSWRVPGDQATSFPARWARKRSISEPTVDSDTLTAGQTRRGDRS